MRTSLVFFIYGYLLIIALTTSAQDAKEKYCGGNAPFSADDLNPAKWGAGAQSLSFGNSKGLIQIFTSGFKHDLDKQGHVAIVCRALLTTATFDAVEIKNVGDYEASVVTRNHTSQTLLWVMRGDRKSHGLNFKVTFWSKKQETPTVDCKGIQDGKATCDSWKSY